jgi:NADP-dependent 3-hydroxy acid dehydrogenase YdfG
MSVWLITGCSTGIGREIAEVALEQGHQVAVTARDESRVGDFVERFGARALPLALDVTDKAQCADVPTLTAFTRDHYAQASENTCGQGRPNF